jgi:uncharacterized membrane protein YczE
MHNRQSMSGIVKNQGKLLAVKTRQAQRPVNALLLKLSCTTSVKFRTARTLLELRKTVTEQQC